MAENKVLKTRIKSLYKTWAEWQAVENTFIPLKGEICIADIPASSNAVTQEPALLIKVGDGVKTFKNLPWLSGLSADVHNWALKETLDWSDLSEDFKNALASYVGAGNEYRINKVGEVYTLQTREYDASTGTWGEWSDVTGSSIDISNKTDRVLNGANGKALIFNESDGGGAKFEHNDGTNSFVGVNDGGANGINGQLYAVNKNTNIGARINITAKGMFYTNGKNTYTYDANDEIATKGNIDDAIAGLGSALRYIGMTELASGETIEQALARIVVAYQASHPSYVLSEGAVAIVDTAEYIFNGTEWNEFGDEGLYATKAELQAARDALEDLIEAEEAARVAADAVLDAKKVDREITGANGKALIFNESDGGGAKFENSDGTMSFVGVNDGGENGITAQLYSVKKDAETGKNIGTRMNMTTGGFYYTNGKDSAIYTANDEIATKGNIKDVTDKLDNIAYTGNVNDLDQDDGDYLILDCNV